MKKIEQPNVTFVSFEELLEKDGVIVYTNTGFSMMPLLRQNKDVIEIRKKMSVRCKKYDVVLYKRNEKYILHRILKVLPGGKYIISGDHNTFKEYDITDDMIIGVMVRVFRNGKIITRDSLVYKIYYHLWVDFFPIRVFIIRVKAILRRIRHLIIKN